MAHGEALFLFRTQAAGSRSLQPPAEARLHHGDRAGGSFGADRSRRVEAGSVFLARLDDGWVSLGAHLAFRGDVGNFVFFAGTPGDGDLAWLEQFCFHADGLEERSGVLTEKVLGLGSQVFGKTQDLTTRAVRIVSKMSEPSMVLNNPEQAGTREQDLILNVQRGQHELFYELVRPYERRVYAPALAILRTEHDAEDAAQEAMLKAFANIRQFRAEARFSTWLIQITVNEALMRRRRERTVQMEGIDGHRSGRGDEESEYAPRDFADWREIPSEALERKEVRQRLAEALATLDRKYRQVFVLRDMEHLNIQETAEALGITVASVKTRLLRARLMLRDLLAAGWEQGWFSRLPFEKGNKPW